MLITIGLFSTLSPMTVFVKRFFCGARELFWLECSHLWFQSDTLQS
jgi:hypothetical protein